MTSTRPVSTRKFKDRCLNAALALYNVRPQDVMRTDAHTRNVLLSHCRHVMRLCDEAQRSASQALETKAEAAQ